MSKSAAWSLSSKTLCSRSPHQRRTELTKIVGLPFVDGKFAASVLTVHDYSNVVTKAVAGLTHNSRSKLQLCYLGLPPCWMPMTSGRHDLEAGIVGQAVRIIDHPRTTGPNCGDQRSP
jgi:hypothetical protein